MAIPLNKFASTQRRKAADEDRLCENCSPSVPLYDISASWRRLFGSTKARSERFQRWSQREVNAACVIRDTLVYLDHIGCNDIEQLIKDVCNNT